MRWCWVYLSVPGRSTNLDNNRARAFSACSRYGWWLLRYILLSSIVSNFLFPALWETARYTLKYCLKGSLNNKKKQPINDPLCDFRHACFVSVSSAGSVVGTGEKNSQERSKNES